MRFYKNYWESYCKIDWKKERMEMPNILMGPGLIFPDKPPRYGV